tara:strand:- start:103 stop:381 length:279 start_codon:yes stop_codon:yes gene_type:complete
MTYEQANQILDRAKEGQQFSSFVINRALALTGDIDPDRSTGMGQALSEKSDGGWEKRSVLLVANYSGRHSQEAGPQSSRGFTATHEHIKGTK